MRKLQREPLRETTLDFLARRSADVIGTATKEARKERAEALWGSGYKQNAAFDEVRAALRDMAPGNDACMYCESGEGSDIDHFWPKAPYPTRAFVWENYAWACSVCNSNYKRSQFPRDENGEPLLINPLDDDPSSHLAFSPRDGKFVALTRKGGESIRVFGLDRRTLERGREDAWVSVQVHIAQYARAHERGDAVRCLDIQRTLCRHPHASLLVELLRIVTGPGAANLVTPLDPDCLAALDAHPEIRTWL